MTAAMINVSMDFLSLNFAGILKFKLGWNKEMECTYGRMHTFLVLPNTRTKLNFWTIIPCTVLLTVTP